MMLLAAVAARGAAIPVVATGTMSPLGLPFSSFGSVSLMADGRISFLGSSSGTFRRSGDVLTHVVSAGDVLPSGVVVAGVGLPAVGPRDCVAVRAFLVGGGGRILRRCGATTDVVAATGEAAPDGGAFAEFVPGLAYGAQGEIAFTAVLDDGSTAIVRDSGGVRTLIARTDGSAGGGVFTAFRLVGVAGDGRVGFRAAVASGRDGLFVSSGDRVQRVVEVGEASPVGGTFRSVEGASINERGGVAFRADLSDGTGGVFRVDASSVAPVVQAVVREGDVVAGDDVRIRSLPSSLTPSINAAGAIAFRATLAGAESGSAIFVAGTDGSIARILDARDRTAAGVLIRLRDPAIADDGSLVIPASIAGSGPALFVYRAGAVSTLAGTQEPTDVDTGPERFRFGQPSVRDAAERAVFSGSRDGIFVATPQGGLETVAFVGGPTVGGRKPLGGTFAGFDPPAADAPGVVVFGAEISGGKASRALIARRGSSLQVVARGDQRVRGGRVVDFFAGTLDPLTRASVGPHGEIAFEAALDFGPSPRALLFGRGGRPRPIIRARKSAPGGGAFESFGTPAVLRGRTLAFVAQVGSADSSRTKLFLRRRRRVVPLAAQGSDAPGRLGGRFDHLDPPDANGTLVAFRATLTQGGREGVYLASRRARGLLVGTGDPAPGGGVFRGFASPSLGGTRAVFLGRLVGVSAALGLYRVAADAVPGDDAPPPAVEAIGVPGSASPLGGQITEFGSFDLNRSDGLAVVVDLVGASARSAVLLVDAGSAIVP
jgi:hypothetical protein